MQLSTSVIYKGSNTVEILFAHTSGVIVRVIPCFRGVRAQQQGLPYCRGPVKYNIEPVNLAKKN